MAAMRKTPKIRPVAAGRIGKSIIKNIVPVLGKKKRNSLNF